MGNRKKATDYILKHIAMFDPNDKANVQLTKQFLESLSDEQFEDYMRRLRKPENGAEDQGRETLTYYAPNLSKIKLEVKRNLEIADAIGHNFFERLWLTDPQTGETYLTTQAHMVVDLPIRRQAQLLIKKSSIPANNNTVDELSGQPTGESKGGKLSFPELQAQVAQQLDNTILEEIKIRGGDEIAYQEFERQMLETGSASLEQLLSLGTKVKSTETLSKLFKGMHFDNNLADNGR